MISIRIFRWPVFLVSGIIFFIFLTTTIVLFFDTQVQMKTQRLALVERLSHELEHFLKSEDRSIDFEQEAESAREAGALSVAQVNTVLESFQYDDVDGNNHFLVNAGIVSLVLLMSYIFVIVRTFNVIKRERIEDESSSTNQGQERDRIQVLLKEKESMFRNLFEGAPIPMIQIDYNSITEREIVSFFQSMIKEEPIRDIVDMELFPDMIQKLTEGRIEYINTAASDLFAMSEKTGKTSSIQWFVDMTDTIFKSTLIEMIAKSRTFLSIKCEFFPRHGAKLAVMVDFSVIQHRKDRDSILVSFQDITSQRREHEEALIAKEEAEAASRLKSTFLTNMTHELKTPLNAIIGFSDLLSDSIEDEQQKEQIELIWGSGRHLLNIIEDILELTKIESDRNTLGFSMFGLQEFVGDFMHPYYSMAVNNGLELKHIAKGKPNVFVFCDLPKLHHILSNLLNNSLKFTETGSVSLEANFKLLGKEESFVIDGFSPELRNEINRIKENEFLNPSDACICRLEFTVTDTGVGIASDEIGRMFEPFVQGDSSITRKYGGTGLGLTVCKKLAKTLGGSLVCEPFDEEGCRFLLVLYGIASASGDF